MKVIFDALILGLSQCGPSAQAGLCRFTQTLLSRFSANNGIRLSFVHAEQSRIHKLTERYLKETRNNAPICSTPSFPLPKNLFGRGERFFNLFYKTLRIDPEKVLFNKHCIAAADIYYSPYSKIPDEIKKVDRLKRVITIHDLIPLLFSDFHGDGQTRFLPIMKSIGQDYAICVSNHTRNDLLNMFPELIPEHVFVAPLAADPATFYPCRDQHKAIALRQRLHLPEKYFLSLCTLEPRKNLRHLLRCFRRFITEQRIHDLHLVLAGAKGWDYQDIFDELSSWGDLQKKVICTGRVPDEDLACLYSNALGFIYMSLYEGFGLPPLEAMQCGTPAVTSNVSSLPEVIGDGGIMLSPHDEEALCQEMHKIYSDETYRSTYQEKGLLRAGHFSWETTADKYLQVFRDIL